jgi:hypothetical protein
MMESDAWLADLMRGLKPVRIFRVSLWLFGPVPLGPYWAPVGWHRPWLGGYGR